jgi:hypothetical protein
MTPSRNADTILMLDDEFDIMSIFTQALEQQSRVHMKVCFGKYNLHKISW